MGGFCLSLLCFKHWAIPLPSISNVKPHSPLIPPSLLLSLTRLCLSLPPSNTFTQVFTISKELVPRILSKIVEAVAEEMCRLMHCVPSFSKNGAMQV